MQYTPQMLNQWETVIRTETQDGSNMFVMLQAMNHDTENRQYRMVYGDSTEPQENWFILKGFKTLAGAFAAYSDYAKAEVCAYFGLETL